MSSSYSPKDNQELDTENLSAGVPSLPLLRPSNSPSSSSRSSMSSSQTSINLNDPSQPQVPNRRVVKSCLWSTVIFSINFISSILVINLAKW